MSSLKSRKDFIIKKKIEEESWNSNLSSPEGPMRIEEKHEYDVEYNDNGDDDEF